MQIGYHDKGSNSATDHKFSLPFIKRLLDESTELEIQIPPEYFDKKKLLEDLNCFYKWKIETEKCLQILEKELNARN